MQATVYVERFLTSMFVSQETVKTISFSKHDCRLIQFIVACVLYWFRQNNGRHATASQIAADSLTVQPIVDFQCHANENLIERGELN